MGFFSVSLLSILVFFCIYNIFLNFNLDIIRLIVCVVNERNLFSTKTQEKVGDERTLYEHVTAMTRDFIYKLEIC